MKKYLFILLCFISNTCGKDSVVEEVDPVRNNDIIVGINYSVTLDKNFNNSRVDTHIIDSIYHYKDLDRIDNFIVNITIRNNSKYDYKLEKILLKDNNVIKKEFDYDAAIFVGKDKVFNFCLDGDFDKDYKIELELKK